MCNGTSRIKILVQWASHPLAHWPWRFNSVFDRNGSRFEIRQDRLILGPCQLWRESGGNQLTNSVLGFSSIRPQAVKVATAVV